mmetsp:Transcript_41009/g.117844  ORF Transcript_41009/g.117844 Transcript_41009/m.117844 type:complete len:487 (+) Transcript_41009:179-1639(+)
MLPSVASDASSDDRDVRSTLQKMTVGFLGGISMVCLHLLLYNLRPIMMPFVLSGFLVLALEPTVEIIYRLLAGLVPPYRWCCCCCSRRRRPSVVSSAEDPHASGSCWDAVAYLDDPEAEAAEPLLPKASEGDEACAMDEFWEGLSRLLAVALAVSAMFVLLFYFIGLLARGAIHMQESWPTYRIGLEKWVVWLDEALASTMRRMHLSRGTAPQARVVYNYLLSRVQSGIYDVVNSIIASMSAGISMLVVILLYVVFWLVRPLPIGGTAGALVRSYIWKKTVVSFMYGGCVVLLFLLLGNDLAFFFGMVSFFLNYVPEVGSIFSIIIPMPIILLDGRLRSPVTTVLVATVGQLVLKLAFSNALEVKLIEQDREMGIHPVWVLASLNYFGYIWGPVGMLISVPMIALAKSAALSVNASGDVLKLGWVPAFLTCLEGKAGKWADGKASVFRIPSTASSRGPARPSQDVTAAASGERHAPSRPSEASTSV